MTIGLRHSKGADDGVILGAVTVHASLRSGNDEEFDRLYRESYPRVLKTMVAILGDASAADDCAQEAFVRASKAWARWNPASSPEAWMQQIAVRIAISRRRRERLHLGDRLRRLVHPGHAPVRVPASNDDALMSAIRSLPPQQAVAVVLRYHHGYSSREIATVLGTAESAVGPRLAKARAALSAALETQTSAAALMTPWTQSQ